MKIRCVGSNFLMQGMRPDWRGPKATGREADGPRAVSGQAPESRKKMEGTRFQQKDVCRKSGCRPNKKTY